MGYNWCQTDLFPRLKLLTLHFKISRFTEANKLLEIHGRNELPEKKTSKLVVYLKLVRIPSTTCN
jgi:hypothetical protein